MYTKSLSLFKEYLQPKSIADTVQKFGDQIVIEEITFIKLFFYLITTIAIIGISIFTFLYARFLDGVYHFIMALFDFPEKVIKNLQNEL